MEGGAMTVRFSASNAARLMSCPGSANLELAIPGWVPPVEDPSKWKARGTGTDLHAVLEPFGTDPMLDLEFKLDMLAAFHVLHKTKRDKITADVVETADWISSEFSVPITSVLSQHIEFLQSLQPYPPKMLRFVEDAGRFVRELRQSMQPGEVLKTEEQLTAGWLKSASGTTPDVTIVGEHRLEVI